VETVLYSPFEAAKIQLQVGHYTSALKCFKTLAVEGGIRGLYLGFWALMGSHICGNLAFFTSYTMICNAMEEPDADNVSSSTAFLAGGIANQLYYFFGHPFDTLQSCTMSQKYHGERYTGPLDCAIKLVRGNGIMVLWRGVLPNLCAAFPGGAACMVTYELVHDHLDPDMGSGAGDHES